MPSKKRRAGAAAAAAAPVSEESKPNKEEEEEEEGSEVSEAEAEPHKKKRKSRGSGAKKSKRTKGAKRRKASTKAATEPEGDSIYDNLEGDAEAAEEELRERPRPPRSPTKPNRSPKRAAAAPTAAESPSKRGRRRPQSDALDEVTRDVPKAASEESDASEPEQRRTKPAKKQAAPSKGTSKQKIKRTTTTAAATAATAESSGSEASSVEEAEEEEAPSLLNRISHGRDATIAREWGKHYAEEPVQAVVQLINLVVEACGCPERVTARQFEAGDVDQVLRALISPAWTDAKQPAADDGGGAATSAAAATTTAEAAAAAGECLITSKRHKKFKERFLGFWDRVVHVSKDTFLYDDFLLPVLTSWITALSSSSARAFRLTATVTGLQIARSVIDVLRELLELRDKAARQQRSERRKSGGGGSSRARSSPSGKLARIEGQAAELDERIGKLTEAVEEIHRCIVVVRYRDAFPEIRVECVSALAQFIAAWPERMLADSYLKYVAWLLNDKSQDVRLAALRGLQDIYAAAGDDAPQVLERFTERFKPRIVQMVLDVAPAVAVEAIALCRTLAGVMQALDEADLTRIYGLVSHENADIRRAAGAFAQAVAFPSVDAEHSAAVAAAATAAAADAEAESQSQSQSQTTQLPEQRESLAEARLRAVIEMAMSYSALPQMPCYVVDALWAVSPTLREWRTMAQMLLRDGEGDAALNEREQTLLAGVLSSACRKAAGLPITPVQPTSQAALSGKELERQRAMQSEMTAEIARLLPRLLEKYRGEAEVAAELTEIVPALSLPAFAALRLEKHMTDLIEQLVQLFARHSVDAVLCPCAAALGHLVARSEPHKQSGEAEASVRTLAERIVAAMDEDASDEARAAGLRRLQRLSERVDIFSAVDVSRYTAPLLETMSSDGTPVAIALLYQRLLWEVSAVDINSGPSAAQAAAINDHRDALVLKLTEILSRHTEEDTAQPLTDAAFVALLDIGTLFTPHLKETTLRRLSMQLGNDSLEALRKHFVSAVVVASAKKQQQQKKKATATEAADVTTATTDEEPREERLAVCYAKAGLGGALPKDHLAAVLCLYHSGSGRMDELARTTLRRLREADRRGEWEVVSLALQRCYEDSTTEESEVHLAEVSKWLALSYGSSPMGDLRSSMFQVVQECVLWALETGDASHLGLLSQTGLLPIANKLSAAEAKLISRLLEQRREAVGLQLSRDAEAHAPYFAFKDAMDAIAKGERSKTPGTLRSSSAKRKKAKSRIGRGAIGKLDLGPIEDEEGDAEKEDDKDEAAEAIEEGSPDKSPGKKRKAASAEPQLDEESEPEPLRRSQRKSLTGKKPPQYAENESVEDIEEEEEESFDAKPETKRKRTPAKKQKKKKQPVSPPKRKKPRQEEEEEPESVEEEEEEAPKRKSPRKSTSATKKQKATKKK